MLPLLIEAARQMDSVFWRQAWGAPEVLLDRVRDPDVRALLGINYGPWDRLDGDTPFLSGIGPKPPGARFYPEDISRDEFEGAVAGLPAAAAQELESLYTLVRRTPEGKLRAVPYHVAFSAETERAAGLMRSASELAEDPGFAQYLRLRADALQSDRYRESDLAWMEMKENLLDLVIGPIETYEDGLFGFKAANEGLVLLKDPAWSDRLARYGRLLPDLQDRLPVAEAYRQESFGDGSDLGVYDALFFAGDANAGSKTIAINLPNDEVVQQQRGARRLQLKNVMQAKFDLIVLPIADRLMPTDQQHRVTFDAFFENTMLHEVAHGLGVQHTITGAGSVRHALREEHTVLEEGKADILGLFLVELLAALGERVGGDTLDNHVTFVTGMLRSIRFGGTSAHGRANLARFNYLTEAGGIVRENGRYRVEFENMRRAVNSLSGLILCLQGDGDYRGAKAFMKRYAALGPVLKQDLDGLGQSGVPVDVVFEQGPDVLGLAVRPHP